MMNKETRELLEQANEALDTAYKNVRIAISDMRDYDVTDLKAILQEIDQSKRKLENLLYPISDIEIFALNTLERIWVFSEANH